MVWETLEICPAVLDLSNRLLCENGGMRPAAKQLRLPVFELRYPRRGFKSPIAAAPRPP